MSAPSCVARLKYSYTLTFSPSMQRRTLSQIIAALALGSSALVGFAQQSITLKFHTFMSPLSNVCLSMHKPWIDKVTKESGGRIKFEAYPAMQLSGTAAQLYDQVKDGVVDIVWTLPGYTAGRSPRIEAFELPFMMNNAEATSMALWDFLHTVGADDFKETRLSAVNVHGPTRPIAKMLGYLGAVPIGLPLPAISDALLKGTSYSCVLPREVLPSIKDQELTRFHLNFDPAGGAPYTAAFVMDMNTKRYSRLPDDLKKIIDNNFGLVTSGWMGKTQQDNDPVRRKNAKG